jgi:hypothetical protein
MSKALQLIGLAVIGAVCVVPIEARAAVGVCNPSHAGEVIEDRSELQAKKRALESWVSQAKRYGEQYARWGIAWNRQLECARTDAGLLRCKAVGRPCTIQQVPPTDAIPLKREGPR